MEYSYYLILVSIHIVIIYLPSNGFDVFSLENGQVILKKYDDFEIEID